LGDKRTTQLRGGFVLGVLCGTICYLPSKASSKSLPEPNDEESICKPRLQERAEHRSGGSQSQLGWIDLASFEDFRRDGQQPVSKTAKKASQTDPCMCPN
jgi:hypothetical protein